MLRSLKRHGSYLFLALGIGISIATTAFSQTMNTNQTEQITFGGGCFWCLEAVFQRIPGVKSVASGYAGGHTENPTYEQICSGGTGHAEVIQLEFDPHKIS